MRRLLWFPAWLLVSAAIAALALPAAALRAAAGGLVPAQKFLTRRMEGRA